MLLHQRIDYAAPTPGNNLFVTIPMSSTLWTVIESSDSPELRSSEGDENHQVKSLAFPSRIVQPDKQLSVVFTGVDTSGLLRTESSSRMKYRILWRIVADPQDLSSKNLVALPLNRDVTFTYSHGSSSLLSLAIGGVGVQLGFDIPQRILSTSWFTPPFTTSWTLEAPRRILTGILTRIWAIEHSVTPAITAPEEEEATSPLPTLCSLLLCRGCRKEKPNVK